MSAITEMMLERPEWFPYFYRGRAAGNGAPDDLELACEAMADLADALVEQRRTMPHAEMDWSTWEAYFRSLYEGSPVLRDYLRENGNFYPDYVLCVFGLIVVRDERSGDVHSRWRARGADVAVGYPWIRTWHICRDRGRGGSKQTLAARVDAPADGQRPRAQIHLDWRHGRDDVAEPVLVSWVVGTLEASTWLKGVEIHGDGEPRAFALASRNRRYGRERFPVPAAGRAPRRSLRLTASWGARSAS